MSDRLSMALVGPDISIKEAIKQLNKNALQILVVVDKHEKLIGTVSDGDIRRAVLKNIKLNAAIESIMNLSPIYLFEHDKEECERVMQENCITQIPVLNLEKRVIDLVLWRDVENNEVFVEHTVKDNPVFILAGGKGTRMSPFTKIIPKPLIPLGDKPILEIIIERFQKCGFNNFFLSLNYKAEMIKMYFRESQNNYNINYIQEDNFCGTAGSLHLIKEKVDQSFLVSNCDVLMDIDFNDLLKFHADSQADITIVGAIKHIKISYGILNFNNGHLNDIEEKPEYDFVVNAGVYVLEPEMIDLVEPDKYLDMPDLIANAMEKGAKVKVYPLSGNWIDLGELEEYEKASEHFKHFTDSI